MTPVGMLVYLGLCALLGYVGREKKFGFVGNFFISLFLSPLVGFVVWLLESDKKSEKPAEVAKAS
jgi:hypothetical protein